MAYRAQKFSNTEPKAKKMVNDNFFRAESTVRAYLAARYSGKDE